MMQNNDTVQQEKNITSANPVIELHIAIRYEDLAAINNLIDGGLVPSNGALLAASLRNNLEIISVIRQAMRGAEIAPAPIPPLEAAGTNNLNAVALLSEPFDAARISQQMWLADETSQALVAAIKNRNQAEVINLCNGVSKPQIRDHEMTKTAILWAIGTGNRTLLKGLLGLNPPIHPQDQRFTLGMAKNLPQSLWYDVARHICQSNPMLEVFIQEKNVALVDLALRADARVTPTTLKIVRGIKHTQIENLINDSPNYLEYESFRAACITAFTWAICFYDLRHNDNQTNPLSRVPVEIFCRILAFCFEDYDPDKPRIKQLTEFFNKLYDRVIEIANTRKHGLNVLELSNTDLLSKKPNSPPHSHQMKIS
jgi:hypothetical protein